MFKQEIPVLDAAEEIADVDEVKQRFFERPGKRRVFKAEAEVRWDPAGLNWGEIRACHRRGGVGVGEVAGKRVSNKSLWE